MNPSVVSCSRSVKTLIVPTPWSTSIFSKTFNPCANMPLDDIGTFPVMVSIESGLPRLPVDLFFPFKVRVLGASSPFSTYSFISIFHGPTVARMNFSSLPFGTCASTMK